MPPFVSRGRATPPSTMPILTSIGSIRSARASNERITEERSTSQPATDFDPDPELRFAVAASRDFWQGERRPDRPGGLDGVGDAGGRDGHSGGQDRDAREAWGRAGVFLRSV